MKRSRSVALVMMGSGALVLSACEEPRVDATIFESIEQCVDAPGASRAECEAQYNIAAEQHAAVAPKYTDQAACEADFGTENCEVAPYRAEGGGSIFMPLMMGYMMGSMLGGRGGAFTQPLYRTADDSKNFRTADNRNVGASTGKTTVNKTAAARPSTKAYTVSRGGFGSGARSYGSAST